MIRIVKSRGTGFAVGTVLLIIGFISGCLFQHAKSGYHFKVVSEKEYPSAMGPVRWRFVSESVGMPFLDPGTSWIEWQGRTLYKAQRIFQEKVPVAGNLKISDSTLQWDDGEYHYQLVIGKIPVTSPPK